MESLPDEQTMLEILELAKDFEHSTRELSEQSMAIAIKYEKQVRECQETQSKPATMNRQFSSICQTIPHEQ